MIEFEDTVFLTAEEVAEKTGINIRTVRKMCRNDGELQARKFGKRWLITEESLKRRLQKDRIQDFRDRLVAYLKECSDIKQETGFVPQSVTFYEDNFQVNLKREDS